MMGRAMGRAGAWISSVVVVAVAMAVPFPSQYPSGQTGRISLFIDAGGDPKTKFQATAAEPNLSSQGTNVIYQLVFETVGTSLQPSIDLSAIDHRKSSEFIPTTARVWQH
jgi:hypothetical protein